MTAFVLGAAADEEMPVMVVPILGGFVAMLLSPLALRWGSLVQLTRTEVTADGTAVHVTDPSREFAEQLPAAS